MLFLISYKRLDLSGQAQGHGGIGEDGNNTKKKKNKQSGVLVYLEPLGFSPGKFMHQIRRVHIKLRQYRPVPCSSVCFGL